MVRNTYLFKSGVYLERADSLRVTFSVHTAGMHAICKTSLPLIWIFSLWWNEAAEECTCSLDRAMHRAPAWGTDQLCRPQNHTWALQAHSAQEFYCLSTALLIYVLNIARGQDTAGEKNLELHFQLHWHYSTSKYHTHQSKYKTFSRKETWKDFKDVRINIIFISHFCFAFLCKIK